MDALDWPDFKLPLHMLVGMKVTGVIEDTGIFRAEDPGEPLELFLERHSRIFNAESNDRWNVDLDRSVKRSGRLEVKQNGGLVSRRIMDITMDEVNRKHMGAPLNKIEMDKKYGKGNWRAMRRFGVRQDSKVRNYLRWSSEWMI